MTSTTDTAGLEQFYAAKIQPALAALETERRAVITRGIWATLLIGLLLLVLAGLMLMLGWVIAAAFVAIGAAIGWFFAVSGPHSRYRASFKARVVGQLVGFVGQNMHYEPEGTIGEGEFSACKIFDHTPDRYSGEDLVTGTHGATAFRFSEVHAEYETETTDADGDRKTTWHTIFKGILFVADFNKHFGGITVVRPDNAERLFGFVGKKLQSLGASFGGRGELISLDDPEFEKHFVVNATDQVEARYILSTSLMHRIVEFKQRTDKGIALSFYDSQVYVAITSNKNHFEAPSIFSPITTSLSVAQLQTYFEDLMLAIAIIDELDLNTRIWSKPALV